MESRLPEFISTPSFGLPIHLYDKRSTGAEAYLSLSREVIARNRG